MRQAVANENLDQFLLPVEQVLGHPEDFGMESEVERPRPEAVYETVRFGGQRGADMFLCVKRHTEPDEESLHNKESIFVQAIVDIPGSRADIKVIDGRLDYAAHIDQVNPELTVRTEEEPEEIPQDAMAAFELAFEALGVQLDNN